MDVTKHNFKELLPQVTKSIDDADFIAIDGEFTGLNNGPDVTAYDLPEEYYEKLRVGKMDYLLVQVGLCAFKYNKQLQKYTHRAYNFYIFPQTLKYGPTANFLCEAASLDFLMSNGFDFNKTIKEGVSYMSYTDEEEIKDDLNTRYKKVSSSDLEEAKLAIPDNLLETVNGACDKIGEYLASNEKEEFVLEDVYNRYIRRLIYQEAYDRYQGSYVFSLETKLLNGSYCLVVQKGKSKETLQKEKYEKELKEVDSAVGFSKVVRHLAKSKKIMVGHNMLVDVCHFINRFFVPLPHDYKEFKQLVTAVFPKLIDTKYMCNSSPFKELIPSSVLDHLLRRLSSDPFTINDVDEEEQGVGYSMSMCKSHEAGYDAYVTGLAFISMSTYLGKLKTPKPEYPVLANSKLLKSYKNRLHLMRLFDNAFVNLRDKDVVPSNRDHIFHITFPKNWVTADILKIFNKYGKTHVSYCNNTSAWVTLLEEQHAEKVRNDLITNVKETGCDPMNGERDYVVKTWIRYQKEYRRKKTGSENCVKGSKRCDRVISYFSVSNNNSKSESVCEKRANADIVEDQTKKLKIFSEDCEKVNKNADTIEQTSEAVGVQLSRETRDFLLTDIEPVESCTEVVRKCRKPKKQLKPEECLEQLENAAEENVEKTFEEPNWE